MRPIPTLALLALLTASTTFAAGIPPAPANSYFVQDYARVLTQPAMDRIGALQKPAYEQYNTPIVVVTIPSMAEYGYSGTIEAFTQQWFNAWGIGKRTASGTLVNRGILVLVDTGDRVARIQLGAEWGAPAEAYSQSVMERVLVPLFKHEGYEEGIERGVAALAQLAAVGPNAAPPKEPKRSRSLGWLFDWIARNWIPVSVGGGVLLLGGYRRIGRGGSGGFSAGGGGFGTGGFSSGRGATGRW